MNGPTELIVRLMGGYSPFKNTPSNRSTNSEEAKGWCRKGSYFLTTEHANRAGMGEQCCRSIIIITISERGSRCGSNCTMVRFGVKTKDNKDMLARTLVQTFRFKVFTQHLTKCLRAARMYLELCETCRAALKNLAADPDAPDTIRHI